MPMLNKSIHPFGRSEHNTSRIVQRRTLNRKIAAIEHHLERHPRDGVSQKHLDALKKRLPEAV